ncbi:MAG: hypothetical protein IKO85_08080 [Bacteroidaceae bacterium]|nr:hypothetical protein [Bacteroidaceae bacterium]
MQNKSKSKTTSSPALSPPPIGASQSSSEETTVPVASAAVLEGIATLTNDPLATYSLHGGRPSKRGSRK